jgi:hypothetical protein
VKILHVCSARLTILAMVASLATSVSAQGGGKPATGNPTPGTPQPEPPNLADRITLTGCIQTAPTSGGPPSTTPDDANTPSDSRFVLTNVERRNVTPAGTGGSPLAVNTSSRIYRLDAIDSQLSAFVGTKVEISGEIKRPTSSPPDGSGNNTPTLLVEFVQKISATCP